MVLQLLSAGGRRQGLAEDGEVDLLIADAAPGAGCSTGPCHDAGEAELGAQEDSDLARLPAQQDAESRSRLALGEDRFTQRFVEGYSLPPAGALRYALDAGKRKPRAQLPHCLLVVLPGVAHYDIFASPALPAAVTPFRDGPAMQASGSTTG